MAALRTVMKIAAARAAGLTGAGRLLSLASAPGEDALVLGYHRVVEDAASPTAASLPAMVISARTLEQQLDWVGRHYEFVSLDELGRRLESGEPGRRPLAAVTFDDGYRDVHDHAFPLLQRKGIPAAVFVVTDGIGSRRLLLHDRLYLLVAAVLSEPALGPAALAQAALDLGLGGPARAGLLGLSPFGATRALLQALPSGDLERLIAVLAAEVPGDELDRPDLHLVGWEMVARMHRAGMVIGSHTRSHTVLTHEDGARVCGEVSGSRRDLEGWLGAPVRHFAYPDGGFRTAVVDEVERAGYAFAYGTCRHRDRRRPWLTVPRRLLWEGSCQDGAGRFSPALMRGQVQGLFDWFGRCRQDHGPREAARPLATA
jgi:peptidoglycan/xylan/chitin deacetylase (PgdA/CDA1 family)